LSEAIRQAAEQAWPPFVLVTGLLLIGAVVEADGLFAAVGLRIERIGGGPGTLLASLLGLEAVVTAVLNLDTAVVFLTPIILHAARQRGCDERPFLYGALFVANGASLLLPGSNLTNLIVLAHERFSGSDFARAMVLPWLIVVVATIGFVAVVYRPRFENGTLEPIPPFHIGLGFAATIAATGLILAFHNAAVPVLVVGVVVVAIRQVRPTLDLHILVSLFALAVALGTLARRWDGPASLVGQLGGGWRCRRRSARECARKQSSGSDVAVSAEATASAAPTYRLEPRAEPGVHRLTLCLPLVPNRTGGGGPAFAQAVVPVRACARSAHNHRCTPSPQDW
jgi:arsenical pump membrane protein